MQNTTAFGRQFESFLQTRRGFPYSTAITLVGIYRRGWKTYTHRKIDPLKRSIPRESSWVTKRLGLVWKFVVIRGRDCIILFSHLDVEPVEKRSHK